MGILKYKNIILTEKNCVKKYYQNNHLVKHKVLKTDIYINLKLFEILDFPKLKKKTIIITGKRIVFRNKNLLNIKKLL